MGIADHGPRLLPAPPEACSRPPPPSCWPVHPRCVPAASATATAGSPDGVGRLRRPWSVPAMDPGCRTAPCPVRLAGLPGEVRGVDRPAARTRRSAPCCLPAARSPHRGPHTSAPRLPRPPCCRAAPPPGPARPSAGGSHATRGPSRLGPKPFGPRRLPAARREGHGRRWVMRTWAGVAFLGLETSRAGGRQASGGADAAPFILHQGTDV